MLAKVPNRASVPLQLKPGAESVMSDREDLSSLTVDELAQIAAISRDENCGARAFEQLIPTIKEVARNSFGRKPQEAVDIRMEAVSIIWQKISLFDSSKGKFKGWVKTVLRNQLITNIRKHKREEKFSDEPSLGNRRVPDLGFAHNEQLDDTAEGPDARRKSGKNVDRERFAQTLRVLEALRDQCDSISQFVQTKAKVDYYAIFIFSVRLRLAEIMKGTREDQDRGELVEWLFPWRAGEECRRFRDGWPTLEQVWSQCRSIISSPPNVVTVDQICQIVDRLSDSRQSLSNTQWNQWVKRAKDSAIKKMTNRDISDSCRQLVEVLFPSRS